MEQLRDSAWHPAPCLWETALGKLGKFWVAAETNQSKLQSIWEIRLTAKQVCLVTIRLCSTSSTDLWTIKMGFVSPLRLKDSEGFRRNAIRSEKNLILCRPTTVDRMPDRQQPNLELTGKICEVQNCYTATLLHCYIATQGRYVKLLRPTQRPAFLHDVSPH